MWQNERESWRTINIIFSSWRMIRNPGWCGNLSENQGYQVWKAANGKEGLEIVTREEIHLAILDIMMPVMDGVTMLMKLREQNHEFPVIMLSAKSEEVDKIMGLNMGADDYVTKPFTPLELLARVNSHLRRYSKYLTAVSGEEQENPMCIPSVDWN